jgi:hypothetical protein
MALVVKDRVQETTTTTGTGTLTLNGAVFGFQTFAIIGDGNVTYYAITDPGTGSWEVGVGTYTASGTTLSRTTVFESSNSGSLVDFAAGTKNVFCTYPAERAVYLDAAGSAVTLLDIGTLGASTANITTANITSGTITTTPVNNTDIVNKEYADAIASGIHFHEAVGYATTAALPACTYNNGTSGVGATLTGDANGALTVDGHTFTSPTDDGTRILIKNQANGAHNGVYTLTQAGNSSPGAPFILTRSTDMDTVGTGVDQIDEGDFFLVTSGTANVNTAWVQQTAPPITIGTTPIIFQQFSAPITYTAGTGLSESPSYTFNIANTGTAGTYGSASNVPVFVTNAQGQVTSVTNTGIAISSAAVSGLAASATTDTTDASNITSGTLGTSRLSGSYTGVTGVGTLTAGTWNATAIGAVYGGTGQSSYAVGDLLYADTTTSLAKLADVAVGNALISGGVAAAPSWGKIGLATHVSGTLPVANGGTGNTTGNATTATTAIAVTATAASGIQSAYQAAFNVTTPGLGTYGIHFNGQTTADFASGITWNGGTTSTNSQAGIYVQGSGAYGTKMYIATTDSYATGAKTAISIDHNGAVNILRSSLTVAGAIKRTAAGQGYLNGDYSSAESISTTGVIYSIGGVYVPTSTSYNNMYGVAYAFSGPGRPMGNVAGIPSDQWAFVGLEAGTPKWALCTSNGSAYFSGSVTTTNVNGFTPTASIVGNRLVATDANGYIFNNYFNSTDNSQSSGVSAVMVKAGDNYYRSGTAAAIATFLSGQNLGVGVGQTWQTVSRAAGTWYQNTTGRVIVVIWNMQGSQNRVYVGTSTSSFITVAANNAGGAGQYEQYNVTLVVPASHYYQGTGSIQFVSELR